MRVAGRLRDLSEAGQIEAKMKELQEAVRAYIVARDALDHELRFLDFKNKQESKAIVEMDKETTRLYEEMRRFV